MTGELKSKDPVSDLQAPHSQVSLNSSQNGQQDPVQYSFHNGNGNDLVSLVQVLSPSRFFFLVTNKCCFALVVGGEGFHDNWDLGSQEILPSLMIIVLMMIAFITIKSSLVPLIEGLCAQIYFRFEISVVCSHLLLFFLVKEKIC